MDLRGIEPRPMPCESTVLPLSLQAQMPTAMKWYKEAAKKYGGVDPTDEKAVEDFFVETFPTLESAKKEEVLRYLLSHEGPSH